MTNVQIKPNVQRTKQEYDLADRTERFGKDIIGFCKVMKQDHITRPLISQLIRSGTSIGANYCEADEASSKKDFVNKVAIANKEAKETKYWLRMISHAVPESAPNTKILWQEAQELNLILASIIRKVKGS